MDGVNSLDPAVGKIKNLKASQQNFLKKEGKKEKRPDL